MRRFRLVLLLSIVLFAHGHLKSAAAETRLALVIGNSAYQHTSKLPNPGRDAQLMTTTLAGLGFQVQTLIDADQNAMRRALLEFGRKLRDGNAVGLFYYAGHGMQVGGRNYLIPVSANIQDETETGLESVSLDEFTATMERPGNPINILILDACRNNPFPRAFRSTGGGLASSDAPRGTYLAYATAPGAVASDGTGVNSPYTAALVRAMQTPGVSIEEVFKQTRRDVLTETKGQQTPWESSSITGNFSFKGGSPVAVAATPKADSAVDIAFWNSIKDAGNRAAFAAYIAQFPNGNFASLARIRMTELAPQQVAAAVPPANSVVRGRHIPVLPQSATRELADGDVAGLDCDQLWLARNEMFQRHGYCFETPRALAIFGNQGCTTTRQDVLTATERGNARTLRTSEIRKRCDGAGPAATTAAMAPASVAVAPPVSRSAAAVTPAGAACDRAAGASWDGDMVGSGVEFAALDAARAIAACQAATAETPTERRHLFQLGRAYDKARDFASAKSSYQRAAALGSGAAMVNLGILYEKGQGVMKSAQEARGYYEKAARAGARMGAYCYATMLDSGAGAAFDPGKAIEWYNRAAELGHGSAAGLARRLQADPRPTGAKCD